jgi:threonine dehydrogenase-like Zn-dependent dehydrogenase
VGTRETIDEARSLLAEAGTYVNLAVHDVEFSMNALDLGSERKMTTSSNALYRDEREAHTLIETGVVRFDPMITHRFSLEAFQEAFDLLIAKPKKAYKVVFTMNQPIVA